MRLSGEEGAQVYATLRARSAAMRTAMLNDEKAKANAVGERMSIPLSLLGVIFMAMLVAPSLLRMFGRRHLTHHAPPTSAPPTRPGRPRRHVRAPPKGEPPSCTTSPPPCTPSAST